jgi:uracil-DNA glycosylase
MFFAKVPGFYKTVSYPVISTYHPAALLRNPSVRPGSMVMDFWEDLKFARKIVDQLKKLYEGQGKEDW